MKKQYIWLIAIAISIGLVIYAYSSYIRSRKAFDQLATLYGEWAEEYLNDKYVENMIVMDGWSYMEWESVIRFEAFPEDNPECKFSVICVTVGPFFQDYYLSAYLETEMKGIIKETVDHYFKNATYYAMTLLYEDKGGVLTNYYNIHKKPLSWYDPDHLDDLWAIVVKLYEDSEGPIDESVMSSLVKDIQSTVTDLGVNVKEISIFIYENERAKEPKDSINYELKNGQYVKQQYLF